MELMSAVYKRKSIRKYSDKKLSPEQLDKISAICDESERLYKEIGLKIALIEEGRHIHGIMSGIVGNIGKVIAPHYLIVTSELKAGYMENAGYTVENVVLQLTNMGIATCWLGGHVKEYELRETICVPENHGYIVMISIGYAMDEGNLYRKDMKEAKRKQISEFVLGDYDSAWKELLEAVRIAPSAANMQPWRFVVEGHKAQVFCEGPGNFIAKKLLGDISMLDVGIALSHLELAARAQGKMIRFSREKNGNYARLQYIATVELI